MRETLNELRSIARAWSLLPALAPLGAMGLMASALPLSPVSVPGRYGVAAILWPLSPVMATVSVPSGSHSVAGDLERLSARGPVKVRGCYLCFIGVALACVLAFAASRVDGLVITRNTALLTGSALLCTVAFGEVPWLAPTLYSMATWLLGTKYGGGHADWALLLHQRDSKPAEVAAAGMLAAGIALFLALGPRRRRGTRA
jgi:hypothetical protein